MQLVFLLIFLIFIFLNVILGLVSSRKKRMRQAGEAHQEHQGMEETEQNADEEENGLHQEMPSGSGPLMRAINSLEETSGMLDRQAPASSMEKPPPSAPSRRNILMDGVSFLHEQSAHDVLSPSYILSEELPSSPEKPPEVRRQDTGAFGGISAISGTIVHHETEKKRQGLSVIQRLETLPHLKRAIVFSEILGTPKGLA